MNEVTRYGLPHRLLHWTMAAAILAGIPIGFVMDDAPKGPIQNALYDLHKSLGVLVLLLALARIALKRSKGVPAASSDVVGWQRRTATSVYHALYVLMVVVPLLGFLANSFYGAPIPFFWLFTIPTFTPRNEEFAGMLFSLHMALAILFGVLITLHIAAALYHRFVRKDGVFARMSLP